METYNNLLRAYNFVSQFANITIFVLGLSAPSFAAEVTTRKLVTSFSIDVVGEIDQRTPKQITAAVMDIRSSHTGGIILGLNSRGGDIEAAIAAGIIARENDMMTLVSENASCASACVLTFLGGSLRVVGGRIGIHRPYQIRYTDSEADAKRSYETINKIVKNYLDKMNITPRVLEAMNLVSPSNVRWLTKDECKDLGIEGNDPVKSEKNDSAWARNLGITKTELYERRQRAESLCIFSQSNMSIEEQSACYDDVIYGRRK
jgi:ATP-dependent protease ClpP protease subunit